jgi:hypothetical protein
MQLKTIKDDFLYVRHNWPKIVTKHAKMDCYVSLKNNKTCGNACFASKRNFAKQQVCFAKHETKLVSMDTLPPPPQKKTSSALVVVFWTITFQ